MCNITGTLDTSSCKEFDLHFLPKDDCYQIGWDEWSKFFDESAAKEVMKRAEKSHYVHLWNQLSHDEVGKVDSQSAIVSIAKEFCPKVFYTIDKYF